MGVGHSAKSEEIVQALRGGSMNRVNPIQAPTCYITVPVMGTLTKVPLILGNPEKSLENLSQVRAMIVAGCDAIKLLVAHTSGPRTMCRSCLKRPCGYLHR